MKFRIHNLLTVEKSADYFYPNILSYLNESVV